MAMRNGGELIRCLTSHAYGTVHVVCFPHAGGAASAFLPIARAMPAEVVVLAVQSPGREDRFTEPPMTSIDDLADACAAQLAERVTAPYLLLGHSIGAIVGYEVGRRLTSQPTGPPCAVVASACAAPHRIAPSWLLQLNDEDLIDHLVSLNGIPDSIAARPETARLFLQAIRADLEMVTRYEYVGVPRPAFPIVAVGGDTDPLVPQADLRAWGRATTGRTITRVIPGGHFVLLEQLALAREVILAAAAGLAIGHGQ